MAALLFMSTAAVLAQNDDPVIMKIAGKPVLRSEFEYSYNKNNTEGVIDRKSVKEYVDLFVNFKAKVAAALDAKYDTLESFKNEYREYRDQQVMPTLIVENDVERQAQKIYNDTKEMIGPDGIINPAHILLRVSQQADEAEMQRVKLRADSVYNAIMAGADFAELAKRISEDPGSAQQGGVIGQVTRGRTVKEFEIAAFALRDGEVSKPVASPFGYHIIKMLSHEQFAPYDSLRQDIHNFINARGIREAIAQEKLESIMKEKGLDKNDVLDLRADSLAAIDQEMKYLFQEYHDGLLLFEISNKEVWEKASHDEIGLNAFFKKNKKKYMWTEPHFKGIAYRTKDAADINAVKKSIKGKPFDQWNEILRSTFNADSVLRIRAEKGIFKKGENAIIDKMVFKVDREITVNEQYPNVSVFGSVMTKPKELSDVRSLVVADYQEYMEKAWVEELRRKYPVEVYDDVLETVNKH